MLLTKLEVPLGAGGPSAPIGNQTIFDRFGNGLKRLLHIDIILGRSLPKFHTKLRGQLLSLLGRHDLLIEHIALVADQDLVDVDIGMLLDLAYPIANGLEGTAVGDVVDKNDALGSAKVGGGDGAESFLTGGIPDLKFDAFVVDLYVLDFEINVNADGCDEGEGRGEGVIVIGVSEE